MKYIPVEENELKALIACNLDCAAFDSLVDRNTLENFKRELQTVCMVVKGRDPRSFRGKCTKNNAIGWMIQDFKRRYIEDKEAEITIGKK